MTVTCMNRLCHRLSNHACNDCSTHYSLFVYASGRATTPNAVILLRAISNVISWSNTIKYRGVNTVALLIINVPVRFTIARDLSIKHLILFWQGKSDRLRSRNWKCN